MPYHPGSTSQPASLPPIDLLFAEVQEREIAQPASPPVQRPSAWPGFPGPDKNALSNSGYHNRSPPPPLQVGRPHSAPFAQPRSPTSPSITPAVHLRDHRSASDSSRRCDDPSNARSNPHPSRSKRGSWTEFAEARAQAQIAELESGRLPPISMTPTGSPHLYPRYPARERDTTCLACAADQQVDERRAVALARGQPPGPSPYAHKQQIPTPLPPEHGHTLISFQPTPSAYPGPGREFGVSMADILAFRPCLKDPDEYVLGGSLDHDRVFLTLEAKGYTTFVQPIPGNCVHRRISRFNLAYAVASAFDAFLKGFPFNPAGLKAAAIVVRSVEELRLVNLYSRDGRTWRVHVAYVV